MIDLTKEEIKANYRTRALEVIPSSKNYEDYKLITFDTETYGLVPENIALAIFFDGINYIICYTKEEINDYLESLTTNTLIYAHNGFNFDYNIFIEDALVRKMAYDKKGGVSFLKYVNKNLVEIIFRDSVYILPGKLADLGKSFANGNYKGITPEKFINPSKYGFNREEYERDKKAFNLKFLNAEDIEYCKQDCLVLYEILNNQEVKELNFKNFNTIAKIANTKMLSSIETIYINNYVDFKFKNLYAGGLTSVFQHEAKGKIGTFDVNSMYPYAMTQHFADTEMMNEYFYKNSSNEQILLWKEMIKNYPNGKSIISLKLKEKTPKKVKEILKTIPLIPNYKTIYYDIFDCNTYKIECMNVELSNLFDNRIYKYLEINPIYSIYSDKKDLYYPFKEFIEKHYNERLKAKKERPAYAQILKLIMNSSYGYFAMQNENSKYEYGTENEIGLKIHQLLEEKGLEVITYQDFLKEHNKQGIIIETSDGYEYEVLNIYDYFNHIKEVVGDFEELQLKSLNEVYLKDSITEDILYVLYYSSEKFIDPTKTSFYIASEITSKSRAYLGKIALDVAFSDNKVCYTDTDSLHIEILNEDNLNKAINKYLDNNILGMLKNEGVYEYGVWLSKKHYYLYKEIDKKLILVKDALKGFAAAKPIDRIIYEQDIINVSKIASRIKNVSFETNNSSKSKNFLNFVVSRRRDGFFYSPLEDAREDALMHKKELKDLYYRMLEMNLYAPKVFLKEEDLDKMKREIKEVGLTKITLTNVKKRIREISDYLTTNIKEGVYDSLDVIKLLSKEEEKHLAREILGLKGNYRDKKRIDISSEEVLIIKKRKRKKINKSYHDKQKEVKNKRKLELKERLDKLKG